MDGIFLLFISFAFLNGLLDSLDAPGQTIRTLYGDGTIVAIAEGTTAAAFRYKVQLAYGIAWIRPTAIVHLLSSKQQNNKEEEKKRKNRVVDCCILLEIEMDGWNSLNHLLGLVPRHLLPSCCLKIVMGHPCCLEQKKYIYY